MSRHTEYRQPGRSQTFHRSAFAANDSCFFGFAHSAACRSCLPDAAFFFGV